MPGALARQVLEAAVLRQFAQAAAALVLQHHDLVDRLGVETLARVERAVGVAQRQHLAAQFVGLQRRELSHVSRARDEHARAVGTPVRVQLHLLDEIDRAVAGGLGTHLAATIGDALAREDAGGVIGKLLHHAGHVADLARADPDVAGRHVDVGADMAIQLEHHCLAEAHDLTVALALGIEVRAALAPAHGQRGERVLEGLLEGQELEDGEVDRGVEAQAALEGPDGHAVLHAVAAVDLHPTRVVDPGDAEHDDALGFHQSLEQALLGVVAMLLEKRPQALHHLGDGLQELRLAGIAERDVLQELVAGRKLHRGGPVGRVSWRKPGANPPIFRDMAAASAPYRDFFAPASAATSKRCRAWPCARPSSLAPSRMPPHRAPPVPGRRPARCAPPSA